MMFHDGEMNGIASRKLPVPKDNLLCTLGSAPINRQHLIDNSKERIKRWLDCVATIDCNVAMQDLLQHFGIRNQALPVTDQLLEPSLRVALVRMRSAD